MERKTKIAITTAAIVATAGLAAGGTAAAVAGPPDDSSTETAITGPALEQASKAALGFIGEGTVTGTEIGDEESLYEVEVTRDDGTQVDVQLDEGFAVVSSKADVEDGE
jgi:hypothetical protein